MDVNQLTCCPIPKYCSIYYYFYHLYAGYFQLHTWNNPCF